MFWLLLRPSPGMSIQNFTKKDEIKCNGSFFTATTFIILKHKIYNIEVYDLNCLNKYI